MNNFVDEVLNGEPKYRVMNENNVVIHDNAKIEMVTPVITQGTALNKAFFDSIKTDLNSRLLTANKATDTEAKAGTNDVKYMTPAKVKTAIENIIVYPHFLSNTKTTISTRDSSKQTRTLIDLTQYTGVLEIKYNMYTDASINYNIAPHLNGTGINYSLYMNDTDGNTSENSTSTSLCLTKRLENCDKYSSGTIRIDLKNKCFSSEIYSGHKLISGSSMPDKGRGIVSTCGDFITATSITLYGRADSATNYSVQIIQIEK